MKIFVPLHECETFIICFIYNLYKDSYSCVTLNAHTAPVAFARRRVSHVVFLISLILEQTSEDCIGNTEHSNLNVNDECNGK